MAEQHELHLYDPQGLYRHWEESQWSPWEIDLSADRAQWAAMEDRTLVSFDLGSLMVAEERITTEFSGLLGADGSEEEVTFLATQQVDEARHMQFYARFQDEVVSEPALIAATTLRELLPAVAESLTPPEGAEASGLGASAEELRTFALSGLARRLEIIGVPIETL